MGFEQSPVEFRYEPNGRDRDLKRVRGKNYLVGARYILVVPRPTWDYDTFGYLRYRVMEEHFEQKADFGASPSVHELYAFDRHFAEYREESKILTDWKIALIVGAIARGNWQRDAAQALWSVFYSKEIEEPIAAISEDPDRWNKSWLVKYFPKYAKQQWEELFEGPIKEGLGVK